MLTWFKRLIATRQDFRRFRYPALAEANKALFAVESEVTDFRQITSQMEKYKKAQEQPEEDRDTAYIPIYLELERFVTSHQTPIVKEALSVEQLRAKVKSVIQINQLNENFRLLFLPENQQTDHLLKIGVLPLLQFLLTSLGQNQLETLIRESAGSSALGAITVSDDGITFAAAHQQQQMLPSDQILAAYQNLYRGLFNEIKKLFGEMIALEQIQLAGEKIKNIYNQQFYELFLTALPAEVKSDPSLKLVESK